MVCRVLVTTAEAALALGVTEASVRSMVARHPELTRYGYRNRRKWDLRQLLSVYGVPEWDSV